MTHDESIDWRLFERSLAGDTRDAAEEVDQDALARLVGQERVRARVVLIDLATNHEDTRAIRALALVPSPESEAALLGLVERGQPASRLWAATVLGLHHHWPSWPTVIADVLSRAEDPDDRKAAAAALSDFPRRDAGPLLLQVLRHDPDADVRYAAAESLLTLLGDLPDPFVPSPEVEALLDAAEAGDPEDLDRICQTLARRLTP